MKTRKYLNKSLPEIGLGCWQLGADWGTVSREDALAILQSSYDAGVRFFDTAAVYGDGRSESLLGEFRKEKPDIFIATKMPRRAQTPEQMWVELEKSCERLEVETIDLLQLHCFAEEQLHAEATWQTLREMKARGAIAEFGASVETNAEAEFCLMQEGMASLQMIFNIFRQKPRELFAAAAKKNVAIIARLPLCSGLLSGKFTADSRFADDDHRNYNRDGDAFNVGETFGGLTFTQGLELVEQLRPMLPAGVSMAQAAMRWILDHPEVSVVIPGASRPAQARENAAVSELPPLSAELHQQLAEFFKESVAPHIRGKQ